MPIPSRQGQRTFRILYAGPERATKYLNLRRLARPTAPLTVYRTDHERILAMDIESEGSGVEQAESESAWIALAVPGKGTGAAVQRMLLTMADAIVFLPARDDPAGSATERAFNELREQLGTHVKDRTRPLPLVIQDYVDSDRRFEAPRELPDLPHVALERVEVAGDREDCVQRVFARVRQELVRAAQASASAPAQQSSRSDEAGVPNADVVRAKIGAAKALAGLRATEPVPAAAAQERSEARSLAPSAVPAPALHRAPEPETNLEVRGDEEVEESDALERWEPWAYGALVLFALAAAAWIALAL